MPDVTIITPTGGRPEQFRLLEQWLGRQTFGGTVQLIAVDDCENPTPVTLPWLVLRPRPYWTAGSITLGRNLREALPHVHSENIIICEDDDYYAPTWVETQLERLKAAPLVAERDTRYYNVAERCYLLNNNWRHGSLFQVAFKRSLIPLVEMAARTERSGFVDTNLFARARCDYHLFAGTYEAIGIKGIPGRAGIGRGHRPNAGFKRDPNFEILPEWIGTDAEVYRAFGERVRPPEMMNGLETFIWRGQRRFRCPDCEFDTYTEAGIAKHWNEIHRKPEAGLPPMPTLFDADGQPINREIYAPDTPLPSSSPRGSDDL